MSLRQILSLAVSTVILIATSASAQHVVPNALLTIDQNRPTVVERIVGEWGERLTASNAGINSTQLREILSGLRADHLLAASLAGNVEGLRNVVAGALVHADAAVSPALRHTKSLGDTGDDLTYTPIVPCRILDTRNGTTPPYDAQMVGGSAFPVAANLANFAPQGGSASSCNLPSSFAAIAVTLTVLNPNFDAFLAASSSSDFAILTQSVVMDFSANKGLANTAIVPVDGTVKFYLGLPAQVTTHVIADAVGYLRRPTNYGGTHTITGQYATDSGGFVNTASGGYSVVAGGFHNAASSVASTVAGGADNTASGGYSTVAGGTDNIASGGSSTVAGGADNIASGGSSTVAGGADNIASGFNSFAAGTRAKAAHDYSFVWGGDQNHDSLSQANNDFMVVATGAIRMYGGPFGGGGCVLSNGNAGWQCSSDRNLKENFVQVDTREVLRRVSELPITRWNSKAVPEVRHIGPMAQDFHALFGVGEDDVHIGTTDAQGVALAAIQGLHQMMRQKDREIAQLRRKLQAIEAKLRP